MVGWLAYHSEYYNYSISYPLEAIVHTEGVQGFPSEELPEDMTAAAYLKQLKETYPDDICVSISLKSSSVHIRAPLEEGGKYADICPGLGVGDYDMEGRSESVTVNGLPFTATGSRVLIRDEVGTFRYEFFGFSLDDGTRITFVVGPEFNHQFESDYEAAYADYLVEKELLLQIIDSYHSTASAEETRPVVTGASLFFARDADLWRARPDGSDIEQITFGGLFQRDPNDDNLVFLHNPLVSPDGRFITFSNDFETLYLVDITGAQPVQPLSARSDEVAWSPDSQQLAYLDPQGTITVFNVAAGVLTALANQPRFDVGNLVFAPDGRSLAYSCCFTGQESPTTGEIRVITLANGREETVGETWSSIGGGSPPLCWIGPDEVTTIDYPDYCSHSYYGISIISPDNTHQVSLGRLDPDDDVYFRRLIVRNITTDEEVWQRDFDVIIRRVVWSLDGSQLFLHVAGEEFWLRNGTRDDAIYALSADGRSDLQLILENAVLLDVIPAWGTN